MELFNLSEHLVLDRPILAVTRYEIAKLRTPGYVEPRCASLIDAGHAKLAALKEAN